MQSLLKSFPGLLIKVFDETSLCTLTTDICGKVSFIKTSQ